MLASSARMCTVSTQATVCFLPCPRRKSGTAASSACRERIASTPRGARSGRRAASRRPAAAARLDSSVPGVGPQRLPRRSPSACRGGRCSARWRGRTPWSRPAPPSPPPCTWSPQSAPGRRTSRPAAPVWPCTASQSSARRRVIRARKKRGEVRERPGLGEHQEPGVVRDQLKTPELLLRLPAGPAVARPALEGAVLPRRQAQPLTGRSSGFTSRTATSDRQNPSGGSRCTRQASMRARTIMPENVARLARERQRKISRLPDSKRQQHGNA